MTCSICGGSGSNGDQMCPGCGGTGTAELAMPRLIPAPPDDEAADQTGLGTGTTDPYSPGQYMRGEESY